MASLGSRMANCIGMHFNISSQNSTDVHSSRDVQQHHKGIAYQHAYVAHSVLVVKKNPHLENLFLSVSSKQESVSVHNSGHKTEEKALALSLQPMHKVKSFSHIR